MKKILFSLMVLFLVQAEIAAQQPLIVYGIKGKAFSIQKNTEAPLKIGMALLPSATIRIEANTSVTLICKTGRQFIINKEGSIPMSRYRDSCKTNNRSVSSNYLAYVWGQMYTYSPEHKKEEKNQTLLAVSRSGGKQNTRTSSPNKLLIEFSKGMDTVYLGDKEFTLSWTCADYEGFYTFRLFNDRASQAIFKDSTENNFISFSSIKDKLETGKIYKWNIAAPKSGMIKRRILKKLEQPAIDSVVNSLLSQQIPSEDSAAAYFRVAYQLEQLHYLADALTYYTKANKADPLVHLYRDQLIRFRNEFYVQDEMQ